MGIVDKLLERGTAPGSLALKAIETLSWPMEIQQFYMEFVAWIQSQWNDDPPQISWDEIAMGIINFELNKKDDWTQRKWLNALARFAPKSKLPIETKAIHSTAKTLKTKKEI